MDLDRDTLDALDWPVLVQALAERARTPLGRRAAQALAPLPLEAIHACFDAVDELTALAEEEGADVPVGGVDDIGRLVLRASKGEVLDGAELRQAGATLGALRDLQWFLVSHAEACPVLGRLGEAIRVDDVLADELLVAFENTGELSARTYPELGDLRRRIQDLHGAIRDTLQSLLTGDDLQDLLQDRFVTQRNDRYVLPIKAHAKRWDLGIVHGTSGTGQTVYVEPKQVVDLNNRLRLAEGELEQAERRILTRLSAELGREHDALADSLEAATHIDLHVARRALARDLGATRPIVRDDGVVRLHDARHPVLVLRGVEVVGNDLAVTPEQPALVVSGPNAGGKTVSLKTVALCALLVRVGAFVPAAAGARVDRFGTVLAAIGDAQSVEGDLSSFSGHLMVLSEMIRRAGPGTLLLLDEIASGTDPAQGAALAQAVLERLLDAHARLVVTTHFARLKALPETDSRFAGAAMEYADGAPTYRVVAGGSGESHALAIAARMGLDPALLERARAVLGEGEGELVETLERLDAARGEAEAARREAREHARSLARREAEVARREKALKVRAAALERQAAASYLDRLSAAEKAIGAVVAELQKHPSHEGVDRARATVDALRHLVPDAGPDEDEALAPPAELGAGDRVRLLQLGGEGEVVDTSGDQVRVRTSSGMTVRMPRAQVARLGDPRPRPAPAPRPTRPARGPVGPAPPLDQVLRLPGNTLDLRGKRVDESLDAIEAFLDRALRDGREHIFVLHGHGTGALKRAVRDWLGKARSIAAHAPATAEQGGDAYTVARLA